MSISHSARPGHEAPDLDWRVNAFRSDLAAEHLRGRIEVPRFVAGEPAQVACGLLDLRRAPDAESPLDSQLLAGEAVTVYERNDGWAWLQNHTDDYVGYARVDGLSEGEAATTHRVDVLRSFVYPAPDLKRPPLDVLSFGATVRVIDQDGRFSLTAAGNWIYSRHLVPRDQPAPDYVATACQFLGIPYLWGGRSSLGLDCSALVQLALARAEISAPRDSDQQALALGRDVATDFERPELRRGDLVFWPGHVAIALDGEQVVHTNALAMLTTVEALGPITERVRAESGRGITAIRRLGTAGDDD